MKNFRFLAGGLAIILLVGFISAVAFTPATVNPSKNGVVVQIPENAIQVAEDVFSLGSAIDVDGRVVEGYAIIDRRDAFNHKDGHNKGKPDKGGNTESSCFAFIGNGAKWKSVENYIVDPSNNAGLNESIVPYLLSLDISKWESESGSNILGSEINGIVDVANIGNLNGKNEVMFADIDSSGTIGVTMIWGIFRGPPQGRELVEWDQVYDDADFAWSFSGEVGKMDFESIANHELGHAMGMAHPDSTCTEETMYASASNGETKKRSLNAGDIAGITDLY